MKKFLSLGAMCAIGAAWSCVVAGQPLKDDDPVTLDRVSEYVERYYSRAQRLVSRETVTLWPLERDRRTRRLVYDLRLEWNPSAEPGTPPAQVVRQLLTADGRPPRPGDDPECMDPKPVSPEPLAILLPKHRDEYAFTSGGTGRIDGRAVVIFDFRALAREPAKVTWKEECVSVELPGRARGKVWADARTAEILRFDEGLTGIFEVPEPPDQSRRLRQSQLVIEQATTSIRYKPVTFADPEETLLLPASIETLTIIRNADVPRMLRVQTFTNYRRFVTEGRIVPG